MCYNAKRFNTHPKGSVLLCGRQNLIIGRPNGIRNDSRGGTTGGKTMTNVVSMKQLLEAGVHFGHPTRKWN